MTDDPTRTITIRKNWNAQFTKRYRALKGDINRFILRSETGLIQLNQAFDFTSDITSVGEFLAWLQMRIDTRIFDNATRAADMWQNIFVAQAYERGTRIAAFELAKQGLTVEQVLLAGVQPAAILGTATPSLGAGFTAFAQPIHLDAIQILYTRDFAALKGITDEMSKQIARVLTDGVEQGIGARELAKNINNRVDKIGLTRSKLLARTESVRSYNVATINEGIVLGQTTGETVGFEWITAGDEIVRSTHRVRNRVIYTPERARVLIGEPNCRCSIVPFVEKLDEPEDAAERSRERAKGLAQPVA